MSMGLALADACGMVASRNRRSESLFISNLGVAVPGVFRK